ncbi:MAG: hypothetical protein BEN18_05855 [Epulopiscium sp. Nuni2H_MBin001]|nr:MAG: hypothetical protein BEN18_05855 [Epulopiscium sp. Nuni2H_MBin001]
MENIYNNLKLLSHVIAKPTEKILDFSQLDNIIRSQIPLFNEVDNFEALYSDFITECDKFKDYVLYSELSEKNLVALGGLFGSGKSSFLNAFNADWILPDDIDPETSVPTYIVHNEDYQVCAVNIFENKIQMEPTDVKKVSHGTSQIDEQQIPSVTLGHMLESILIQTPKHNYANTAFLDTAGYAKPYSNYYTHKTDELGLRSKLNSSNFILWFISAETEFITQADINLIKSVRKNIPKLIIVTKADTKPAEVLDKMCDEIKLSLANNQINYVDVLKFSSRKPQAYDSHKIKYYMDRWDNRIYLSSFAKNLKVLFRECINYYTKNADYEAVEQLKALQNIFFAQIKVIADKAGIYMTQPEQVELIRKPLEVVREYKKLQQIRSNPTIKNLLANHVFDSHQWRLQEGSSEYTTKIVNLINGVMPHQ